MDANTEPPNDSPTTNASPEPNASPTPNVPSTPNVSWKSLLTGLVAGAAIAGMYGATPSSVTDTLQTPATAPETQPLSSWLEAERPIALQKILDNVGASGSKAKAAKPGVIIASPSRSNPDYFYTWTRDSALTIEALVNAFNVTRSPKLEAIIRDYISVQSVLQKVDNPSGGLESGGLGEAKYNVNLTAFTGDWGRPQRDGPALRAIALAAYARDLISKGQNSTVNSTIWPILEKDLSYVTQHWNKSTFDLWEEVKGASFFTTAMQYRSVVQGSKLAQDIGRSCGNCTSQAHQILDFLQSYWNHAYITSNTAGGRSGKDLNSILTSTHMFDMEAGCDGMTFQPCSDKALANHKVVTDSFRSVYAINKGTPAGVGVAVGRYAEDVYMGGNPWYLGNFAAAEMLYQAASQWKRLGAINVTAISQPFFKDVYPSAKIGTIAASSPEFKKIIDAVVSYADSYMEIAQKHTPVDGSLAEQFSRDDGRPLSAGDLTWSYVAFLTAYKARKGAVSVS